MAHGPVGVRWLARCARAAIAFVVQRRQGTIMARGSKESYSNKQKRQAEHIEDSYKEKGVSQDEAEERAWRTVNKQSGGGKKSGSGKKS